MNGERDLIAIRDQLAECRRRLEPTFDAIDPEAGPVEGVVPPDVV